MPTLTYAIETRCRNCGLVQITTIPQYCRWVNANDGGLGSGYYFKNDPTQKRKKRCEHCKCDALKKQGIVTKEELEALQNES